MLKVEVVFEKEADVTETTAAAAAAGEESVMQEVTEDVLQREAPLITKLSAEQIRIILEDVCTEMLSGLKVCAVYASAVYVYVVCYMVSCVKCQSQYKLL